MVLDRIERKPRLPIIRWGHPLAQGLVGAWPFYEGGGTTVSNIAQNPIGTGRHGDVTSFGSTHSWTEGDPGLGVVNGSGAGNGKRLALPDLSLCENAGFPSAFSFFVLLDTPLFPGSDHDDPYIFDFGDGDVFWRISQNNKWIRIHLSGTTTLTVDAGVGSWDRYVSYCSTFDGNGAYKIWVDGVTSASGTWVGTPSVDSNTRSIGGHSSLNRDLIATFYDVRFWNRALTEQEVDGLHYDMWELYRPAPSILRSDTTVSVSPGLLGSLALKGKGR